MIKFMMSIGDEAFRLLSLESKKRDVTVQQLLRAVILPDWVTKNGIGPGSTTSAKARRSRSNKRILLSSPEKRPDARQPAPFMTRSRMSWKLLRESAAVRMEVADNPTVSVKSEYS